MARSTWKLDEHLICPQCEHYNALTCGSGGYQCRDCGYLFQLGAPRCEGCEGPITKRCGVHCYEPAAVPDALTEYPEDVPLCCFPGCNETAHRDSRCSAHNPEEG